MLTRITFRASLGRAWTDTLQRLDLRHPSKLLVPALVFAITLYFFYRAWGQEQMMQELRWPVTTLVALGLVFGATLIANLILAPFRLVRAGEAQAEDRARLAEDQARIASERWKALVARQPDIKTHQEDVGQERFLVVENVGANAEFKAQIRIKDRHGDWTPVTRTVFEGTWAGRLPRVES
jgi:hypothetical protein